ncbi:MAG: CpaF family protein, partial [Alphaproteobacteria bacterium]|nr:CpaF family protein [Alphaproteobacteria bacterium]
MFGKRSTSEPVFRPPVEPEARAPVPPLAASAPPKVEKSAPPPVAPSPRPAPKPAARAAVDNRSEDYYQIKSTIFNALIDTIDLAQLAQLDPDSAREEIRDIVNEIISIKAVV